MKIIYSGSILHESIMAGGEFELDGEVHWTSFREMSGEPDTEIQEA